jgi:hypothetical protein
MRNIFYPHRLKHSFYTETKRRELMQERQQTSVPNIYFDLVSVLYNSLQAAQAASAYLQDAQQSGNQQLVQFFQSYQQTANQQAQQAQQILSQVGQSSGGRY